MKYASNNIALFIKTIEFLIIICMNYSIIMGLRLLYRHTFTDDSKVHEKVCVGS